MHSLLGRECLVVKSIIDQPNAMLPHCLRFNILFYFKLSIIYLYQKGGGPRGSRYSIYKFVHPRKRENFVEICPPDFADETYRHIRC
jgi:hypothetical protein